MIVVMDFRAQCLEPLLNYAPLSWSSEKHNLMPATGNLLHHIYLLSSLVGEHLIHGSHGTLYLTRNSEEVVLMQSISRP